MVTRFLQATGRVVLALIISLSFAGFAPQEARAAAYIVSNTNDLGPNSLRQAMLDANASAGVADTITFSVSGTIALASDLPIITGDLTIDGSGQTIILNGNDLRRGLQIGAGVKVTLRQLTITHAKTGFDSGGGVRNQGELVVEDCTFTNNWALQGGAIYSTYFLSVTDSTFLGNTASGGSGGAIELYNSAATISGSTFSGNHAAQAGGGIEVYQTSGLATAIVSNSTFAGNTADYDGGGINVYYGTLTLVNSTFSGNGAGSNGGGLKDYGGTVHLKSTILANSTSGQDCYSALGLTTSLNNLFGSGYQCGSSVSGLSPNLGPLADNGGPTQTMGLLRGSPAINAGDDTTCLNNPVNQLDQRGVTRPYGTHCDIGAYELKTAGLTVSSAGAKDGHILETLEFSGVGGTVDATATTFNLGDTASDRQYRAILSFYTGARPEDAVFLKVELRIRKQGVVGTNPFTILGRLKADIRKPYFGTGSVLAAADFQAAAQKLGAGTFGTTAVDNWYSAIITSLGYPYINKTGTTQFRLRFLTDDNDDMGADYMKFFSGNYGTATERPTLVIDYYIP